MGGHVKEDGTVNLASPARWNSAALGFLAATTSATAVQKLLEASLLPMYVVTAANVRQHPLLKLPWEAQHIKKIVPVTMLSVHFSISL